ncbi:MAG: molybdopterin molybdotransferase MoeA [Candidatus Riflebacteria bacterium]|nr:molybdopterin molybdotransferase MoeA [Candidatus Riflebacteria bacterium]
MDHTPDPGAILRAPVTPDVALDLVLRMSRPLRPRRVPLLEGVGRPLEIMTGAPCPAGTQAVIEKERVRCEGAVAALPSDFAPFDNIAALGSECRTGRVVLRAGDLLTPLGVAAAASFGMRNVLVLPAPRVAVITTGGELADPDEALIPGRIRNTNGPMVAALLMEMGLDPPLVVRSGDNLDELARAIVGVDRADLIVLTGGVSVGKYDLVPDVMKSLGAEVVFSKVRQKPGKPLLFALREEQLLFGLSGNPLACHLGFSRYVAAAVRRLAGDVAVEDPEWGTITEAIRPSSGRTHFVLAVSTQGGSPDRPWMLSILPTVGAADIFGPCRANCYVEVPPGSQPIAVGDRLGFRWLGKPVRPRSHGCSCGRS